MSALTPGHVSQDQRWFLRAKGLSCGHECVLGSSAFWE